MYRATVYGYLYLKVFEDLLISVKKSKLDRSDLLKTHFATDQYLEENQESTLSK